MESTSRSRNASMIQHVSRDGWIPCSLFCAYTFSTGSGWGNALQEHLVKALLTYNIHEERDCTPFPPFWNTDPPPLCHRFRVR